ncbi:hypothetical protein AAP_03518 [Ascosphaera apis ARSEF 7405]|uniref:Microbial-type PARG catalytic domain-containing protein n=1 Tax=Ascosphaera apis ARSEF 7405 TaxID=392613 RepID=A0A167YHH2_9EURO|nr:hypothetical protein AAP_03518 [Ascosphaera apis ARSEF 7405]
MSPPSSPPLSAKRPKQELDEQTEQQQEQQQGNNRSSKRQNSSMLDYFISSNRVNFRALAAETIALLPNVLSAVPHVSTRAYTYDPNNLPRLRSQHCPRIATSIQVKVVNEDTLDAAINVGNCARYMTIKDKQPVCILNMANAYTPGGGFRNGAMAQEEAICYRSSLYFTLKNRYYPLHEFGGLFSPNVLVFRNNDTRRTVMDLTRPDKLPIVCAVSVAAINSPNTIKEEVKREAPEAAENGLSTVVVNERYADFRDREKTKEKMRVILRIAAYNRCRRLVLGAFGCGAFRNPNREVARCWAEVLRETEFRGGWWETIVFAVYDPHTTEDEIDPESNYGVFREILDGMTIS